MAVLTTITVIAWVFFSVYRVLTTQPSAVVPAEFLEPIDPTLDITALDKIQERVFFEQGEIVELTLKATPTPTASPSAEEVSRPQTTTETGESPAATGSGQ